MDETLAKDKDSLYYLTVQAMRRHRGKGLSLRHCLLIAFMEDSDRKLGPAAKKLGIPLSEAAKDYQEIKDVML